MQQFQPLRRDFQIRLGHARDVAAWPVQAGDEAELDRIGCGFTIMPDGLVNTIAAT
jgi:hypothetical protein